MRSGPSDSGRAVGKPEVIRFIRQARWRRFFRCALAASNFRSGKHYYLVITARRRFFDEQINFDPDEKEPFGWRVTQYLYRVKDIELLKGKCDEIAHVR
jgi:hypothetical protein